MRLHLCEILARWVYKNTNARDDTTMRCFCSGLVRLYRGKIFARWVYKNTNACDDTTMRCFCFGLVRLHLCKIFARWVYKNTNACDDTTRRCFCFRIGAFVSRARNPRFYFVHVGTKPRFLTKKGPQKSGIPCSVCIFVKSLQDGFTKIQTHAMRWHDEALLFFSGLVQPSATRPLF
jgi:hypothetical protein